MYAGMKEVQLWYVRGLEGQYWTVKLDAEAGTLELLTKILGE